MWVGQGHKAENDILIERLYKCLEILDQYEGKVGHTFHLSFLSHFKAIVFDLLDELQSQKVYSKEEVRELEKLSKYGADLFTKKQRKKHSVFIETCRKLNSALTQAPDFGQQMFFKSRNSHSAQKFNDMADDPKPAKRQRK